MLNRRQLIMHVFDTLIYFLVSFFILVVYPSHIEQLTAGLVIGHAVLGLVLLFVARSFMRIYSQIWRYAGPAEYILLLVSDMLACMAFIPLRSLIFERYTTFVRSVSLFTLNLLACISVRLIYQWTYQNRMKKGRIEKLALMLLKYLTGTAFADEKPADSRVRIVIIGAGSVGAMLADELLHNPKAMYQPVCFVDIDKQKTGREIYGIPVLSNEEALDKRLSDYSVQQVVFAIPNIDAERRMELFRRYEGFGYKIKTYDYPTIGSDAENGKRQIHDFAVEDLLFRSTVQFLDPGTVKWYSGKCVLITGGGGSIGSELARQIAKCEPSRLVLLDIYENGVYDVQQELKDKYGAWLNLDVEIASICDREALELIVGRYRPDIVLHAAAHKHVPLMENNVVEAVKNNVFGTLNLVEICEQYGVRRFIMISTDKAVNPTNVMGATKRMCEMIVQSRNGEKTSFSATRFGNVLGSNGSVIPLFKRQIAAGGPVTITDKRIIRYFMTIPEASQLVMMSGAMAENGELYVLDMGKPVKILDLAENMIRLSGLEPYKDIDIVETGLRPGEKLYEELLIQSEDLDKTDSNKIYVERDKPLSGKEIEARLAILKSAVETRDDRAVMEALKQVIPTYHTPEEVNQKAIEDRALL